MHRSDVPKDSDHKVRSFNGWYWWTGLSLLFSIFWIYYIVVGGRNVIYADQYRILPLIVDQFLMNSFNFFSLWQPHLEHRLLGYNIIVLANILFFNYNTLFEMYCSLIILIITTYIIFHYFSSTHLNDNRFSFYLSNASIIFAVLSLSQADIVVWSIGIGIFLLNFFFICTILCIDKYLYRNSNRHILYCAALMYSMNILLFSGGYGIIQALSIMVVLSILLILKRFAKPIVFTFLIFLLFTCASLTIYYYDLNIQHLNKLEHGIEFLHIHKFVLYALGNAFLGNASIVLWDLDRTVLFIGASYLSLGMIIFFDYIFNKRYNNFMWPIVLIIFSFLGIFLIAIARIKLFNALYGLQPRYISTTIMGIVGISAYRIYLRNLPHFSGKFFLSAINIWLLAFIGCQIINSSQELRIAPHRGLYFDELKARMVRILCNDIDTPDAFFSPFNASNPDEVRKAVATLAEHRLSFFKDWKPGSDLNSAVLHKGWHGEEHGGRWIGTEALFTLGSTDNSDRLIVAGHIPHGEGYHRLRIISGRDVLYDAGVSGAISIAVPLSPRKMIHGAIMLDRRGGEKPFQQSPESEPEKVMFVTRLETAPSIPVAPMRPHSVTDSGHRVPVGYLSRSPTDSLNLWSDKP